MNEVQHRADYRRPRLYRAPAPIEPLIGRAITIVLSMLIGAMLLAIVEVVFVNLSR